jgi:hypothetical protein
MRRVAAAPFQALANIFGGSGDLPAVPPVAPSEIDEDAPGPNMDAIYRDLAIAVRTWCAKSIIAQRPLPLPPKSPRGVAAWLPGLSIDEAHAIINATEIEVMSHLRSRELINGVCRVRPLEPAVWPVEPESKLDPGSLDVSCGAGYALAR